MSLSMRRWIPCHIRSSIAAAGSSLLIQRAAERRYMGQHSSGTGGAFDDMLSELDAFLEKTPVSAVTSVSAAAPVPPPEPTPKPPLPMHKSPTSAEAEGSPLVPHQAPATRMPASVTFSGTVAGPRAEAHNSPHQPRRPSGGGDHPSQASAMWVVHSSLGFWTPVVRHLISEAHAANAAGDDGGGASVVATPSPPTAAGAQRGNIRNPDDGSVILSGYAPIAAEPLATAPSTFRLHKAEIQRLRRTLCDLARAVQVFMNARPQTSDVDEKKRGRRAVAEVLRLCVEGALQARAAAENSAERNTLPKAMMPSDEAAMLAALRAMSFRWVRTQLAPMLQRELLLVNFLPIRLRGTGLIEPPAVFVSSRHAAADGSLIIPSGEDFATRNVRIRAAAASRSLAGTDSFFADMAAALNDSEDGGGGAGTTAEAVAPSPPVGSTSATPRLDAVVGASAPPAPSVQQHVAVKACVAPTTPLFFISDVAMTTGAVSDPTAAAARMSDHLTASAASALRDTMSASSSTTASTTTQAATTAEYQALLRQVCATATSEVWQPVLREIESQRHALHQDLLALDERIGVMRELRNEIRSVIAEALGEVRERDRLLHLEVSRLRGDGGSSGGANGTQEGPRGLAALEPPPVIPHHAVANAVAHPTSHQNPSSGNLVGQAAAIGVSGAPVSTFDEYGAREAVKHAAAQLAAESVAADAGDAAGIERTLQAEADELSALAGTVPSFQELARVVPHFG